MNFAEVGELIGRAFTLVRSNALRVLALTLPIVIVVTGVTALGLGELGAHYHGNVSQRDTYIQLAATELVTVPLISSILARWVAEGGRGGPFHATERLATAFEAFPNVLVVIVLWLGAVLLGSTLILPGIYVLVSWYFVVQAVVLERDRGLAAIMRSATLVRGNWWRSAATGVGFQLTAAVPQAIVLVLFDSL